MRVIFQVQAPGAYIFEGTNSQKLFLCYYFFSGGGGGRSVLYLEVLIFRITTEAYKTVKRVSKV